MKVKNSLKKGAAILGFGALGALAGNTLNAQEATIQEKDSIEVVQKKDSIQIVPPYIVITPTYKPINFIVNKDPRYDNATATILIKSDMNSLEDRVNSKFLQGIDSTDLYVIYENTARKMSPDEYLGTPVGNKPLPQAIANYFTSIVSNEGKYKQGKKIINKQLGAVDSLEHAGLIELFNKADYNKYFGYAVVHYDATKTRTWDESTNDWKKDKKGNIIYERNPALNMAVPFQVRLNGNTIECKPIVANKNYSRQETLQESDENAETIIGPSLSSAAQFGVTAIGGYNWDSKAPVGQIGASLTKGRLEAILFVGGGYSDVSNSMDFPSNVGGTTVTDYVKTTLSNLGIMAGYDVIHNDDSGSGIGILIGLQRENVKTEKQQNVRQWVTDSQGNYRDVTFQGPINREKNNHYDMTFGPKVNLPRGWSIYNKNDFNLKTRKCEASYLGLRKSF